uniref:Uncharacterized protein n=1 Tax=Salix viminalis TaxID=40686 RepID=A0A6N2M7X3_SALVM
METTKRFIGILRPKLKQGLLQWLEGFKEACCLHRVVFLCFRSRKLLVRTGQCFLLNGFIFLGRYNDIAKYGFEALGKNSHDVLEPSSQNEVKTPENSALMDKLCRVMIGIGEQVPENYMQVYATGFIPYIGKALNFVLLSWMYAYYCFEYKWNLSDVALDRRLDFFESNWAFFSGFDNFEIPCSSAACYKVILAKPMRSGYFLLLSSCELWCYGVMAILFPLVQGLNNLFFHKEENGKAWDWEGFQYFVQRIHYRCGFYRSCPWILEIRSKTRRHSEMFWHNSSTMWPFFHDVTIKHCGLLQAVGFEKQNIINHYKQLVLKNWLDVYRNQLNEWRTIDP